MSRVLKSFGPKPGAAPAHGRQRTAVDPRSVILHSQQGVKEPSPSISTLHSPSDGHDLNFFEKPGFYFVADDRRGSPIIEQCIAPKEEEPLGKNLPRWGQRISRGGKA
ncbi:hypothetical protein ANO14919_030240 [Xylariales sp. No.14919]|nr:hypothetical protein ANO14919_030240 [Xylariales sp. No.14919]